MLRDVLLDHGFIAILRGIRPPETSAVAEVLYGEGFRAVEVPCNSPQAIDSIGRLREILPRDCLVGAGTVVTSTQVNDVRSAGGNLVVMPHGDKLVIQAAIAQGLEVLPGVATPNEAFAALAAGVTLLKVFPADHLGPAVLKAWLAVLPAETGLVPVGGITPNTLVEFLAAGAAGFGIASALYKPGMTAREVRLSARRFMESWRCGKFRNLSRLSKGLLRGAKRQESN